MAAPRFPGNSSQSFGTWDKPAPPMPPVSFVNGWNVRCPGIPPFNSAETLKIKSLRDPKPVELPGLSGDMRISQVKDAFRRQELLTARKAITLRWHGADLDDATTLDEQRIQDGATLEAAFRVRSQAELESLRVIKHILIVDTSGEGTFVDNVNNSTPIVSLKTLMKAPETAKIFFSPAFTSNFGAPLLDENTLGSYGILDGDVLYYASGEAPAEVADAGGAKPAGKKK